MNLFKLTSGKLVRQCAEEMAAEFSRLCPLPGKQSGRSLSPKTVERALAEVYSRAKVFRQAHHLGIFGRARLARAFQDELRKRGYSGELVSQVTASLVTASLSGK